MGSDNRHEGESPEGAEALVRRVKRAKDSTRREPSGSEAPVVLRKYRRADHSKMEGLEVSQDYAYGILHGLTTASELLESSVNFVDNDILSSQIELLIEVIAQFKLGENVYLPGVLDD